MHPSFKNGRFLEGMRSRNTPLLAKVSQYDFPDTATFGGSLLNDNFESNTDAETYWELALLFFFFLQVS